MLAVFVPGLLVALGAAAATAHGLFEVAGASGVPGGVAWIYPLITDGLAIVAYAATSRLPRRGRRYAWSVVILAAGLSGLAQAVYLAGGVAQTAAGAAPAGELLRFGVGAWPAIAAAIVAHLLFMLAAERGDAVPDAARAETPAALSADAACVDTVARVPASVAVQPGPVQSPVVQPDPVHAAALDTSTPAQGAGRTTPGPESVQPTPSAKRGAGEATTERPTNPTASPMRDRARAAARRHQAQHGELPTVAQLMQLAEVSRGTAGTALQELREQPAPLQLLTKLNTPKATS
jgi:hypothetical protein